MIGRIRRLRRSHPALPGWILLLSWVVLAFRVRVSSAAPAGILDDLSLIAAGVALFAMLEMLPRGVRSTTIVVAGIAMAAAHAGALVYFRFYNTFIGAAALSMAKEVGDARTIIQASLGRGEMLALGVIPALCAIWTAKRAAGYRRRRSGSIAGAALATVAVTAVLRGTLTNAFSDPSENNPVAFFLRDVVASFSASECDLGVSLLDVHAHRDETYFRPAGYRWGAAPDLPLLKTPEAPTEGRRWNVVLIVLESVRGYESGLAGTASPSSSSTVLSALAAEGLHFPNVYFNASQTAAGEVAILCSLLPAPTREVIYVDAPDLSVRCLPEILSDVGYTTLWINGYRRNFTNRDAFLGTHGFQHLMAEKEISDWGAQRSHIGWGIADEDVFDFALDQLEEAAEPFFAEILTLSNHAPRLTEQFPTEVQGVVGSVGASEAYRGYLAGIRYTDGAVGRFLEAAKGRSWFHDTVFVIMGDHGAWIFPSGEGEVPSFVEKTEMYLRGGLVVWAPSLVDGARLPVVGSQIDVAPTILDLLGVTARNAFQGVSLLDDRIPAASRRAVYVGKNSWSIRRGDEYCYAVGQSCFESEDPRCPQGTAPAPASHACFRSDEDLLAGKSPRSAVALLDERERHRILSLGNRVIRDTTLLTENDRLLRGSAS